MGRNRPDWLDEYPRRSWRIRNCPGEGLDSCHQLSLLLAGKRSRCPLYGKWIRCDPKGGQGKQGPMGRPGSRRSGGAQIPQWLGTRRRRGTYFPRHVHSSGRIRSRVHVSLRDDDLHVLSRGANLSVVEDRPLWSALLRSGNGYLRRAAVSLCSSVTNQAHLDNAILVGFDIEKPFLYTRLDRAIGPKYRRQMFVIRLISACIYVA